MRQTDRKGAIIVTILAVMVLACVLIICAFMGSDKQTASAETILNTDNFTLNYGRIEGIGYATAPYVVVIEYYDTEETTTGVSKIKTAIIEDNGQAVLKINNVVSEPSNNALIGKYLLNINAEDSGYIRAFSLSANIQSDNEILRTNYGVGYFNTEWTGIDIPYGTNYNATVTGDYVFLGINTKEAGVLIIENSRITSQNYIKYPVVFCLTADESNFPTPNTGGSGAPLRIDQVLYSASPLYKIERNTENIRFEGYREGLAYADNRVNTRSASYIAGYNAGAEGNLTFLNMLTAVVDAPVKAIAGIFNIEILGYNMLYFITGLLTIGLVFFIVRKLGGGL